MPEGDTVWRTARRLHQALAGERLTAAELRWPQLSTLELRGETTREVLSRGKHLLHRLGCGVTIHSHLRMEGQWRVEATAAVSAGMLAQDQLRAVLGTASWTALGLRLGELHVVPSGEEDALVGHLGPDVLGPGWDASEAVRRVASSPAAVGSALLDQRNLAGVGTLYAAESLFLEGLSPWTPARDIDAATVVALVARVHGLLEAGRRRAAPSTTGVERRGHTTYVHGRSGRPCRRCGGPVRVATIGKAPHDRTMFYCPGCQGGFAPTDDGRPQRPLGAPGGDRRVGSRSNAASP